MLSSILGAFAVPARLLLGHLVGLHSHGVQAVGSASEVAAWSCAVLLSLMGNAIVLTHLLALFLDTVLIRYYRGADLFDATPLSHHTLHGRLCLILPDTTTVALVLFSSQLSRKI